MKLLTLFALATALTLGAATTLQFKSGSTITVNGTSNVHDWSCTTTQMAGALQGELSGTTLTSLEGGRLTIPVQGLECGNGTMNRLMRSAMNSDAHPHIQYTIARAQIGTPDAQGRHTVTANGTLAIAGKSQNVRVSAQAVPVTGGNYRLTGTVPLTMTQFGIDPPRAMMGAMRTADAITVSFDVLVGR